MLPKKPSELSIARRHPLKRGARAFKTQTRNVRSYKKQISVYRIYRDARK